MAPEFFQGLLQSIQPFNILAMAAGSIAGIIFGMIPGLTTTTATIVFLPLTFVLSPSVAVALLFGIYTGGFTGSAFSATLINIPGGPSAAATLLDGHPMAKRGEGARALGIAIFASFVGGLFSFFCLSFFAPQLASVALQFRTPELFALVFFGLSIISSFSVKSVAKGLLSAVLGLILCTIGQDPIRGIGRFTFDNPELLSGFHLIPALVGIFAFPELVNTLKDPSSNMQKVEAVLSLRKVFPSWEDIKTCRVAVMIGSVVGTFTGFLPGAGGPIAVFMAYDYTRKTSKRPELFGTGL
ncbi:MAG: tripartite tricarboxylate transporter permease, partial [Thermodesulfobacteriota bacterium]